MIPRVRFRVRKPSPIRVVPDDELADDIGAALITGINRNVFQQKKGAGSRIKRNTRETLAQKQRRGRGSKSLVDRRHRFLKPRSFEAVLRGKRIVVRGRAASFRDIIRYVRRLGYRGWEKPDARATRAIIAAVKKWIRREIVRATEDPRRG